MSDTGPIMVMNMRCPICARVQGVCHSIRYTDELVVDWAQCYCGTMFHKEPIQASVWNEEYRKTWKEMKGIEERMDYWTRIYAPLIEDSIMGRKMLDVGYTHPTLIEAMGKRGWVSTGIDLIPDSIMTGDFEEYDFGFKAGDQKFDLIVFSHVLESMKNPEAALKKAHGLINRESVVFISMPDPQMIFMTGAQNFGHLNALEKRCLISRPELEKMAQRCGFDVALSRTNTSRRFHSWYDTHMILTKRFTA